MSESEDGGPGTREIANRLFAAEFDDSDLSYSESDEERAPNYVITPSGARVNRLFLAGVLTEEEWVNDEMLRARIVDPTGAFVTYAGQYQPDALAFLERTDSPAFLAVTGKARTFEPEDGDRVFTSVRPESISEVDGDTRDRWVVEAARRTIDRTETMAAAIETGLSGEELTAALEADGVEPSLASGIALALDHYGTTPAYLDALHTLAVEALETVAGERDEVTPLDVAPDEGTGDASALADRGLDAATATESDESDTAEGPAAEFEPVEEGTTAEPDATPTDTEQAGESSPTEAVTSDGVPVATDDAATASEDEIESVESDESDDLEEPDEPAESDEPGDFELDDVETEIEEELDEFDPEEDDVLTDEEREEVEAEFGTEFSTGDEVEPEPELDPDQGSVDDEEREAAETESPASETASATTADTDDGGAADSHADDDDTGDDGEQADGSVDDAVMETMAALDDGDGADRDELVSTVAEQTGATPDEIEAAVQDALMSGQCYEPADGKFKPI